MDELDRNPESIARPVGGRVEMLDAASAIRLAESIVGSHVHGDPDHADGAGALLTACHEAAEKGQRVCAVVRVEALGSSRETLRRIAAARLGVVAHAIAGHGAEELSALVDVGWGVLCASGPEDSFDLSLVARRAAEDSGVPFVVVHALGHASLDAGRSVAMVALPPERAARAFVGERSRLRARHDPAHPSLAPVGDRVFAERVPFALASAMREYGAVSGRRHDLFDKAPLGEPPLVFVGMGPVGDAVLCAVGELRARGYDIGAVHVTALRPFPGARLVKTLSRALAVTVLEAADEPLSSQGGLLARELKSAFTDAITWVPGFPGIGRIPKLFSGVTGPAFSIEDLAAACENMLLGERGRRSFSLPDADHALPPAPRGQHPGASVAMRWVLDDLNVAEVALGATAALLAETLGLRVNGVLTPQGGGAIVDLFASREHARGVMARRPPRILLASERGALSSEAVSLLGPGGVLGVLSPAGDGAVTVPEAARAVARDKRFRILPLATATPGLDPGTAIAATCAGASLAAAQLAQRATVDPAAVARFVTAHFRSRGAADADRAGDRARRAFELTCEGARSEA